MCRGSTSPPAQTWWVNIVRDKEVVLRCVEVMLEQARVVVVSTRLGSYIVQREEEEEFEEDQNEEDGPRFTIRQ